MTFQKRWGVFAVPIDRPAVISNEIFCTSYYRKRSAIYFARYLNKQLTPQSHMFYVRSLCQEKPGDDFHVL
jgi:hypothetical protein